MPVATPAQLHAALRTAVVTERNELLGVLARHEATPVGADDVRHALRLRRRSAVHVLAQAIERRRAATVFEAARMRDAEQLGALLDDAATAGSVEQRQAALDEAAAQRDDACVRVLVERGGVASCATPLGNDAVGNALRRAALGGGTADEAVKQHGKGDRLALLVLAVRAGGSGLALAGNELSYAATRVVVANCGACLEWRNQHGTTWLHFAAYDGWQPTARALIDSGAQLDVFNVDGDTPLAFAAGQSMVALVRLLLENGADANATRRSLGFSPLHLAASRGHGDCLQLLLQHGVDVEQRDLLRRTALHYAALNGHVEVVQLLIDAGADVAALTRSGRKPERLAVLGGCDDAAALLRSAV